MELRCDLDVIGCRGRFDSSWVCVFVDIPIANDAETLLQDRVLIPCGVGARHDDFIVVFVAHGIRRYRMVGILEDSLNDVDALFGLILCTCRALSVDIPITFRIQMNQSECFIEFKNWIL